MSHLLPTPAATPYARMIVADDEAHIRHIIARKLSLAGFTVYEARNGQEALALIDGALGEPVHPHLVITDLQMPLITGLEMAQVLKQRQDTCDVPLLMLTARGYILSPEELARTNIREVISKPFGVRPLLERVIKIIAAQSPLLLPPGAAEDGETREAA